METIGSIYVKREPPKAPQSKPGILHPPLRGHKADQRHLHAHLTLNTEP